MKNQSAMAIENIQNKKWEQLFILTQHWKSDIEFYRDDLYFLYHLINKNFMWITNEENLEMVKTVKQRMYQIKEKSKNLLDRIKQHQIQLGLLIKNDTAKDVALTENEHENLEQKIADFVKSFRKNRKEVFAVTEHIIDSEELPNLVGHS